MLSPWSFCWRIIMPRWLLSYQVEVLWYGSNYTQRVNKTSKETTITTRAFPQANPSNQSPLLPLYSSNATLPVLDLAYAILTPVHYPLRLPKPVFGHSLWFLHRSGQVLPYSFERDTRARPQIQPGKTLYRDRFERRLTMENMIPSVARLNVHSSVAEK